MPNNNQPPFSLFLKQYVGGDAEFRRKNRHVLEGLDILSRLEDLYDRGQMTAAAVRREIQVALANVGEASWRARADRAAAAFLSASGADRRNDGDSYASLWQKATRMLEGSET